MGRSGGRLYLSLGKGCLVVRGKEEEGDKSMGGGGRRSIEEPDAVAQVIIEFPASNSFPRPLFFLYFLLYIYIYKG